MNESSPISERSADDAPDVLRHVRRAVLASAAELCRSLDELRPDDRRRQRALDRWFSGFAAQLRNYHELLDTLVVPALASRGAIDQRSLNILAADHAWIDQILGDLGDALGVLSFGLGSESWWIGKASDLGAAMTHVLTGQFGREQRMLDPLLERFFDAEERDVVRHDAMRRVASGPVRFSLAWLYAHVDRAERARLAAYAPTTSRLIWRSQRHAYQRTAGTALGN